MQDSVIEDRLYWTIKSIEDKLSFLEKKKVETARECRKPEQCSEIGNHATSDVLKGLVEHRQNLQPGCDNKEERLTLSKQIQKEVRRLLKTKKREQIAERLTKFKDSRNMAGIRTGGKRNLLHVLWIKAVGCEPIDNKLWTVLQISTPLFTPVQK